MIRRPINSQPNETLGPPRFSRLLRSANTLAPPLPVVLLHRHPVAHFPRLLLRLASSSAPCSSRSAPCSSAFLCPRHALCSSDSQPRVAASTRPWGSGAAAAPGEGGRALGELRLQAGRGAGGCVLILLTSSGRPHFRHQRRPLLLLQSSGGKGSRGSRPAACGDPIPLASGLGGAGSSMARCRLRRARRCLRGSGATCSSPSFVHVAGDYAIEPA
ncbi:hypothetical protein GQ55_7G046300 [Panicum hallii var. hallii]|uniref:Uncharacterized protein n=1 Tax=Panicum hallii var. hallii TaxID=1504633 RepID=A0A2T7CSR3_9POAL|nr:hypothetical protein GQ55_7G046300 [Panicum hallii var. hallii]